MLINQTPIWLFYKIVFLNNHLGNISGYQLKAGQVKS